MSTSRLEKFIYAICSMEVSDLPAPLSRIEILWNCLITGETPDFEPQSRNEQYLMAMLGLYELENLPTPMSRGEKLLYKIAVGETDLSDVPGYLSRYEELLKYLIENGGIGNFEYVLYTLNQSLSTLYQTVEKPVKSAILKGNTLVNLAVNGSNKTYTNKNSLTNLLHKMEANKLYLLIIDVKENTLNKNFRFSGYTLGKAATKLQESEISGDRDVFAIGETGRKCFKVGYTEIKENAGEALIMFCGDAGGTTTGSATYDIMFLEYQQGMKNWDIPYFEAMQSVKTPVLTTTGKNLFNKNNINFYNNNGSDFENTENSNLMRVRTSSFKINSNNTYVISGLIEAAKLISVRGYDENKKHIANSITINKNSFYVPDNIKYIHLLFGNNDGINVLASDVKNLDIQLELGSVATSYEPFKTNILTVNEDVELRGIGDVRDTIDCLTGQMTERIVEVVFDGSVDEGWSQFGNSTTQEKTCLFSFFGGLPTAPKEDLKMLSDKYIIKNDFGTLLNTDEEMVHAYSDQAVYFRILKSKLSTQNVTGFKEWLSQNPFTIQYQLKTESVKTVDLTTVDQDGQSTKLKTFNDISYVEINADSIIPSVNVEVATKINKTLSTMGLEHHDISETQNKLSQTIDEQTENTDATMMATTEIYENL